MSRGRILVIRGGAIGDFVLTLPAMAALRRRFPDTHLEVLGYPHIARLAKAGGWVDAVKGIEARGLAGFFARHSPLDKEIADYFGSFHLIVSYLYDPDGIFATNLAACTDAQVIYGRHRPDESVALHATEVYLEPLERLAIFGEDPVPRLAVEAGALSGNVIVLHPGSGSDRKNWPELRWIGLIQRLIEETDHRLLIVGGEAEGARLDRLAQMVPAGRVEFARSVPLPALAARMRAGCAFVGHDSGITHIAAAVGLPCVVLWPETNAEIWKPRGEGIVLLKEPRGLRALDGDWVFQELSRLLNRDGGAGAARTSRPDS